MLVLLGACVTSRCGKSERSALSRGCGRGGKSHLIVNAVFFDTQPIRSFLFQNWMVLLTLDNVSCTASFGKAVRPGGRKEFVDSKEGPATCIING